MFEKALGTSALSTTRIYKWHKDFKSGGKVVESFPSSGRPSTVKEFVIEDCHTSLRELVSELNLP